MTVTTKSFQSLFYQSELKPELPPIDYVTKIDLAPEGQDLTQNRDETVDVVRRSLGVFETVFSQLGLNLKLLDLSVLADDRAGRINAADNYYNGIIRIYSGEADIVWRSYINSIRSPKHSQSNYQSILTHPKFYSPENALFLSDFEAPWPPSEKSEAGLFGYRFFPNEARVHEDLQSICGNIQVFIDNFTTNLNSEKRSGWKSSELTCIAVPIVRAYYQSALDFTIEKSGPTPGGTLFAFVERPSPSQVEGAVLLHAARLLSFLLLRGVLSTSISSSEREELREQARNGSYSFAHPLKHRLGDLNARIQECMHYMPSEAHLLSEEVMSLFSNTYEFAEQAHLLHFAVANGSSSLRKPNTPTFKKYMSESPLNISLSILGRIRELYGPDIDGALRFEICTEDLVVEPYGQNGKDELVQCRLHDQTYIQIFYELLKNIVLHGVATDGKIPVKFERQKIRSQGDPKPAIVISNPWQREPAPKLKFNQRGDEWVPVSFASPSGLSFVAMVLNKTSSGTLLARVLKESRVFEIGLMLDGLR